MLKNKSEILYREAMYEQLLAKYLQDHSKVMESVVYNLDSLWYEVVEKRYIIPFIVSDGNTSAYSQTAIEWRKYSPLTQLSVYPDLSNNSYGTWGLLSNDEYLISLKLPLDENVVEIQEDLYACAYIYSPIGENPLKQCDEMFKKIEAKGKQVKNSILFQYLETLSSDYVFKVFIPIEKI